MIDATTGGHLWAERYDGSLSDVFTLQDKVTGQIVNALELNLTSEDRPAKPKATSVQAYDAFKKGWSQYQRHTASALSQAVPQFREAIRLDPDYVQAHAALAAVYWEVWDNHWEEALDISRADAMNNSKTNLQQAMKEPGPLAHWVASNILISEGNYATAVKVYRVVDTPCFLRMPVPRFPMPQIPPAPLVVEVLAPYTSKQFPRR